MLALFCTLMSLIFGCHHRALSRPLTVRQPKKRTYVVCLTCGAEFDYEFAAMQICRPAGVKHNVKAEHEYAT